MGPLQQSLAKALPPPPTSKNCRKKSNKQQATTMQWHDNISSYKCFETIATPSPIPIAKNAQNQSLHRSTSLDSLANSEANHSDRSSQDSWCDIGDADSDSLSHCDSITDPKDSDTNAQESIYEPYFNDTDNSSPTKPIITQVVKKTTAIKLCENKHCAYRQFEKHHLIDDCAPSNEVASTTDAGASAAVEEYKPKENTPNVPFVLNKTRRTSVASSGSVSRMETIVEEPIEPKISVKEILARFETLTSLEVHFNDALFD